MSLGVSLGKNQCLSKTKKQDRMIKITYACAIGSIMYAMIRTKPNGSYGLHAYFNFTLVSVNRKRSKTSLCT